MRLLVVEDDDIVADAITRGLSAANFSVHRVVSAETAQSAIAGEEFALAVIDVGLPGTDGLTLVRRLRSAGKTLPTLILTARCTLSDKVKALDIGADDFLSKPFEPAELVARCRALMRRASGALDGVIKLNRMSVDLTGRRLLIDEAEVELTAREWLVFECLVRRTGQIVSKDKVQQAMANREQDITPNAVEVHVSRLRSKLGDAAVIRSLRGSGLSVGRSEAGVSSSISRQLVFWLAVPLMLLALCGALVHYFNSVAPGVISSDRRLRDAATALMARLTVENGRVRLDETAGGKPPLPAPDSICVRGTRCPGTPPAR